MQKNSDILAPSLRNYIEENLGKTTLHKIEQRLAEKYGLGIPQAIKEFSKLDNVLKEIFGKGAAELESKFIKTSKPINSSTWASIKISLVSSIRDSIEENLGKNTLNKIEFRLKEKYNLNTIQAIEDFAKFDDVLQEFFGSGAQGLKSRFIQNIIKSNSLKQVLANLNGDENLLVHEFLRSFDDNDKNLIIELSIKQSA
jgi:RNase P/RNase MRP subunit POP5